MEKSKKIDVSNRPTEKGKSGIGGASCPVWIFGDEKSADNDLKEKFNIVDDEEKNKHKS